MQAGDKLYISPEKLLPLQRFLPQPKGAGGGGGKGKGKGGGKGKGKGGGKGAPPTAESLDDDMDSYFAARKGAEE